MSFKLSIVAPSGKIFEDTVDSIAVCGTDGAFEVYSKHMPLISTLKAGLPVCDLPAEKPLMKLPAVFWKSILSIT